ncbi:translational GTPase TypA [Enterobacteriaceae endosymbiont of Neohaemonia nigricornis]|uniref:translational GTPase TypA n=1 Tax=Enterobacteriaceae endosymbiont of Neohaemonia nigricornis TaxID=2675792 RepID=UPI00144A0CBF|nr:translational GTPase TypA [Enterobacteriaceae endosymbiont of Neohaemonia nigricornis]QJC30566.1 translational GTPase TypA [Enterobacteriaceae endosymbiont of Neohaemonia nigricornis]
MQKIRNIAIIAHVDHGKTTLLDKLLEQSDSYNNKKIINYKHQQRLMDTNYLEKEKGITIFSKQTTIFWNDYQINIIDTPGHTDLSAEVERILSMVDSVLLVVDAIEGPMPQTRFVTQKSFEYNLKPIIIINKIDRKPNRIDWVINQIFDLFIELNASDIQLDFPIIYTSAINGTSGYKTNLIEKNMDAVFNSIIKYTPHPNVNIHGPFQMQVSQIKYDKYLGNVCFGLIKRGHININDFVTTVDKNKKNIKIKILYLIQNIGLKEQYLDCAYAGNIIGIAGTNLHDIHISDTICNNNYYEALPALKIDPPKINILFHVNNSPFAGQEGQYVTSTKILNRLTKECLYNISLKVKSTNDNIFCVSGRGTLHLSLLIENMRREGYEFAISKPKIIECIINNEKHEPFEILILDFQSNKKGKIIEYISNKKAIINNILLSKTNNRIIIECIISSRALIGFRTEFMNITAGTGIMNSFFSHYSKKNNGFINKRNNGVLISNSTGYAVSFALSHLQSRGILFIKPGEKIYEGQIVGIHNKSNDLTVNCLQNKKLTNMRASGSDNAIILVPNKNISLEYAIDFINDDELIEITPTSIRFRKQFLKEKQRRIHNKNQI